MANKKISELTAATTPAETDVMPIVQAATTKKATVSAWVRGALLTGLSTAMNSAIAATDSVLVALGKLQAQITAILASLNSHIGNTTNAHGMTAPGAAIVKAATVADQRAAMGLSSTNTAAFKNIALNATLPAVAADRPTLISGFGAMLFGTTYDKSNQLTSNLCHDGSAYKYVADGYASMIRQNDGNVEIFTTSLPGLAGAGAEIKSQFKLSRGGLLNIGGTITHATDNTHSFGTASQRASVVYAASGTINTSDAREKTSVTALTSAEIQAAKLLAAEIGTYQWLASIESKGADARKHIGMTVQRAIEVMESCGLDPFAYGFICFDEWGAVETEDGETTQEAGNRYSFRPDELLFFIARGFEARLAALEAK